MTNLHSILKSRDITLMTKVHLVKAMVFPVKVKVKSLSRVWLFGTPWIAAYQAPPSMGFSRQEYWSGLPLPSLYMTTGKTIALTRQTFVGKVMSLLLNTLPRLIIAFLPRSKHLLISWLQSPSAVILEPKKIQSVTASTCSPSICHEVVEPDAMILVFWMSR